jgi:iron(III) transport system substrate-binding protein
MRFARTSLSALAFAAAATAVMAAPARADGDLTLYCSPQIEWCEAMITAFQKETGITVAMTR